MFFSNISIAGEVINLLKRNLPVPISGWQKQISMHCLQEAILLWVIQ